MKSFVLALACALALMACAAQRVAVAPTYSPLILISIDGYRADYLERGLSPTLARLARNGVRAQALKPAFPTLTFPNHYTIVTGLYPDHHGIVNNRFTDPVSGEKFVYNDVKSISNSAWWGGEPLWVSVERQGKHAATMFWPGSDVAIGGVRPEHWRAFDAKVSPDARVVQVLQWLDLPANERPDFVTLYFDQVDHAAHDHGPDSPEVSAALRSVDAALARLRVGLKQRGLADTTNLVVVSDHGMAPVSDRRVVVLDRIIDPRHVDLVSVGVITSLAPKPGYETQVERAMLAPHEHMHCWTKNGIPPRLHYGSNARIPPLLCLPDDGWQIETQAWLDRPDHRVNGGEHGYDNDDPNMRALFVANGPAFRRGLVVPEFDNVDIYPLLTHLLGITPAPNDGDFGVVAPMLAPAR